MVPLVFRGEAAAVAGVGASASAEAIESPLAWPDPLDLPHHSLQICSCRERSIPEASTGGLLRRDLIREPLISAYGLSDADLKLLKDSPFLLTLRPLVQWPRSRQVWSWLWPLEVNAKTGCECSMVSLSDCLRRGFQTVAETATSWR